MIFFTPIWLILLLPWAVLSAWVLLGRADFARVPTTQFWENTGVAPAPRRGMRLPPWPIVALVIAMLLSVLAASGMSIRNPLDGSTLTLIVDCSLPSARMTQAQASELEKQIRDRLPALSAIELLPVPGEQSTWITPAQLAGRLRTLRPTAAHAETDLHRAIARELLRADNPIIVITSLRLDNPHPRVITLAPPAQLINAGIERFAVTEKPAPQAMVRVWNGTGQTRATLRVDSAQREIDLPATGESKDYFVDLPALGESVRASLAIEDDLPEDNEAYLARTTVWPRIEARGTLPRAVGRMIDVYANLRPPGAESKTVVVTSDPSNTPAGIIVSPGSRPAPRGTVRVETDHPVTRGIDWNAALADAKISASVPPGILPDEPGNAASDESWRALVSIGDWPVVAESAGGRLWIGMDLTDFSARADFVVLMTNAFDHAGRGAQSYTSQPPRKLDGTWRRIVPPADASLDAAPGVYRNVLGLTALTLPAIRPVSPAPQPVLSSFPTLRPATLPLAPVLLIASILLILFAVGSAGSRS